MAEAASEDPKKKGPDLYDALVDAVDEAQRGGPGDVLVFLPGEREIREAAEALRKAHHAAGTEVLALFARQSAQEQARVFAPSRGRRVILCHQRCRDLASPCRASAMWSIPGWRG